MISSRLISNRYHVSHFGLVLSLFRSATCPIWGGFEALRLRARKQTRKRKPPTAVTQLVANNTVGCCCRFADTQGFLPQCSASRSCDFAQDDKEPGYEPQQTTQPDVTVVEINNVTMHKATADKIRTSTAKPCWEFSRQTQP